MELDDLRRQWQRPTPAKASVPLSAAELTQLVARQSGSIVGQLRRNARLEMGINYALLIISLGMCALAPALWLRLCGGLLALVAAVCIYYLNRKLGLLRSMDDPAGNLRVHLLRITEGLRALIRFYYRFTLAMIPVTALMIGTLALLKVLGALTPAKLALIGGGLVVEMAVLYWPASRATAWYLQRLYGQHLDRLEGQLRELNEGPLPDAKS
ncbi:hypothetical protein QMK33_05150 [Hymenobacter sp. H14-R3]|uniref:hypothetical protein n=1 Tax=Hymenobacter sp. H14-R3 TaxID=3046308 RepID=UPI0024BA8B8F|nr:hypothetical protein [Hymenobacter sp. H14-R3]MDJ0364530.1 hypothetical protein [Hymenobacter sp. H14-R3]